MPCKAGHIVNYTGYCRLCGAWLFDPDGPMSPFQAAVDDEPENDEGCHNVSRD
jgi:hypothetical protein